MSKKIGFTGSLKGFTNKLLHIFNFLWMLTFFGLTVWGLWLAFEPDPLKISKMFVRDNPYNKGDVILVKRGEEVEFGGLVCFSRFFDVDVDRTFYLVEGVGKDKVRDGIIEYPRPKELGCQVDSFTLPIPERLVVGNTYDYYPDMTYPINFLRKGNKQGFGFTFKVVE